MGQKSFFDFEHRLEAISAKGDPLETIKKIVPWEDFRADIEAATEAKPEQRKSNAGRKPYDTILKFKIVVLQSLHNLSDEQTEYRNTKEENEAITRPARRRRDGRNSPPRMPRRTRTRAGQRRKSPKPAIIRGSLMAFSP